MRSTRIQDKLNLTTRWDGKSIARYGSNRHSMGENLCQGQQNPPAIIAGMIPVMEVAREEVESPIFDSPAMIAGKISALQERVLGVLIASPA